jgi:hypothetical protein
MPRSGYEPTGCLNNVTIVMCIITEGCNGVEPTFLLLELNKNMGKIFTVSAWFSLSVPVCLADRALFLCCSETAEEVFEVPVSCRGVSALPEPAADLIYVLLLKWRRKNCISHHKTLTRDGEETLRTQEVDKVRCRGRKTTKNHRNV